MEGHTVSAEFDFLFLWHHDVIMIPAQVVIDHPSLSMVVTWKCRVSNIRLCNLRDHIIYSQANMLINLPQLS